MTRATSSFACKILGWAVGVVGLVGGGCGPGAPGGDDSGVVTTTVGIPTTSAAGSTAGPTGESEAGAGTTVIVEPTMPTFDETTGTTAGTTGVEFIVPPDGGGLGECDTLMQDCPVGEKCMPYSNDGGSSWNDTKCVPVMEDPANLDEPCFVVGNGLSGVDNCDLGLMCWETDAENQGTCIAMCKGTPEEPYCEELAASCAVWEAPFSVCIGWCDPLAQDCEQDFRCAGYTWGFFCRFDELDGVGQAHDPCKSDEDCSPGLQCVDAGAAVECDAAAETCCEPFCDLDALDVCPGAGQVCNPWFEPGTAPPGYEDVGICGVPM